MTNGYRGPGGGVKVTDPRNVVSTDRKKLKVLLRLGIYLAKFKWIVLLAILMTVSSNLFALIGPRLSGKAIDAIVGEGQVIFETVFYYCALMAMFYVLSSVLSYLLQVTMIHLSRSIVRQMREDIFAKLMRMRVGYFDRTQVGDIISRISYDIDTINATLSTDFVQICTSVITVVGALIMMIAISPPLCLIFAVTVPASILFTTYNAKRVRPLFRARSAKLGELNGYAEEMLSGQRTIRAYGREEEMIGRFDRRNTDAVDAYFKADYYGSMVGPTVNSINNLSLTMVSVFGALLYLAGTISLGNISSFVLYSRRFSGPINEMANIISELQSAASAAERVFRLLDEEEELPDVANAYGFTNVRGEVEAESVQFGYDEDKLIIKNLNLKTKPGQTVAIVGPTGAGKTTIINLLMRYYDVNSGEIRLDGTPIRQAQRATLRRAYTMVLQDTWLFTGTIRDNIAYGASGEVTEERIKEAAKAAGIHSFIEGLPDGYDTIITDDGVNISKGQRQLMTIARAMMSDAPMLILDEATSNVDSRTEMRIQKAMLKLMEGRTSFVIAHRLSTVRDADVILVLRDGVVIESGSHDELLAMKGFYHSLFFSQFKG